MAWHKNNYPHVQHQFDVWHVAKSITKTLTKKAKNKECSVLFPGIKAISNHLWWCANSCERDWNLLHGSGLPLSSTRPISTCRAVYTYTKNVPTHSSLGRRQGQRSGFVLVSLHMMLLMRLFSFKTLFKDIEQLTLNRHTGSVPQRKTAVPFRK